MAATWLRRTGHPHRHARVRPSAPGAPKDSKPKTRCFASFPSCLIFSARGSYSASARHPVLTMHSVLFLPTFSRRTLQHVMQPYEAPFKLVWAPLRRTRHAPLGTSRQSWRAGTIAGHAHRPGGLLGGLGRCPRCAPRTFSEWAVRCLTDARGPACLRTASEARRLLVVEGWTDVPSWELVEQGARPLDRPDGIAEPGEWRHGWQMVATLFVAHTEPFLPRPRAAAFFAAFPPCALAFPDRSARRCMAPSYPERPPHLAHP